jgi:hypothetical protein
MADLRYIRKIDEPTTVLARGYFDDDYTVPEGFEMMDGEPPEGFQFFKAPTLAEELEAIFVSAVQQYGDALPPEHEADLWLLKAGITDMLQFNRVAAAKAKIESITLPESLNPIRDAMLARFPE